MIGGESSSAKAGHAARRREIANMRGALGKRLTTQGDILYDLSKVYQSLCGYDFLLLDQPIKDHEARMLEGLRQVFWDATARYATAGEGGGVLRRDAHR